jgi:hypothetical protein
MPAQSLLPGVVAEGTDSAPASHLREMRARLRVLYQRASKACPQAIVRAADHLEVLHDQLAGVMENLGGPRTGEKWRKALSAVDRIPSLLDLAYLSTLPQAEPRAAVRSYARRLLIDVGDTARPSGSLAERVGAVATGAAGLAAALLAALADNEFTDDERADIARRLDRAEADVRAARALLSGGVR